MRQLVVSSFCFLTMLSTSNSYAQTLNRALPIRVAVIDTGIAQNRMQDASLCKTGHKDFTGRGLSDNHGHGTHIYGLIDQYAKNISLKSNSDISRMTKMSILYCQIIIKFYDSENFSQNTLALMKKSIRYAIDMKVDIINISAGGIKTDREEASLIKEALDSNILVIVAAGNNGQFLTLRPKKQIEGKYFPALHDRRIAVIGNGFSESLKTPTSNYGPYVDYWELGADSTSLGKLGLVKMSGTSQSAAIFTGKFIRFALSLK